MTEALSFMDSLRKNPQCSAITMCSENANQVGKMGVDSVVDGKLPNGEVYDWNKDSRIGRAKGSKYVMPLISTDRLPAPLTDDDWMTIGIGLNTDDE